MFGIFALHIFTSNYSSLLHRAHFLLLALGPMTRICPLLLSRPDPKRTIVNGQSNATKPMRKFSQQRFQANDPNLKIPSKSSKAKVAKRQCSSKTLRRKVSLLEFPSESSQETDPKRKISNGRPKVKDPKRTIATKHSQSKDPNLNCSITSWQPKFSQAADARSDPVWAMLVYSNLHIVETVLEPWCTLRPVSFPHHLKSLT